MNCFLASLTNKRGLALFPTRIIARDPHIQTLQQPWADIESAQSLSLACAEWGCTVVITSLSRGHRKKYKDIKISLQYGIVFMNLFNLEKIGMQHPI